MEYTWVQVVTILFNIELKGDLCLLNEENLHYPFACLYVWWPLIVSTLDKTVVSIQSLALLSWNQSLILIKRLRWSRKQQGIYDGKSKAMASYFIVL